MKWDDVDRRLIAALSQDGRRAAADLAKELGLSRQAVTDRMRLLEEAGVIRAYRADVAPAHLGLDVHAIIRLQVDGTLAAERDRAVRRMLQSSPHVRAVYHVTGEDCYVVDVVCRHISDVNALLTQLKQTRAVLSSRTAFVLETVLDRGAFGPVDPALLAADCTPARPAPGAPGTEQTLAARRARRSGAAREAGADGAAPRGRN